jgi:sulfur carrier protein ThiS
MTITLMSVGAEDCTIEIAEGTTVATFLDEQDLTGTIYVDAVLVEDTETVLNDGARVLVVADKSVKSA